MFSNKSDVELSQCEGDLYAKSWLNLLEQGYKGEMTEKEFNNDIDHRILSRDSNSVTSIQKQWILSI